jgi:hypothetical protein
MADDNTWAVRITYPDGTQDVVPFNDDDERHAELMVVGVNAITYHMASGDYRYELDDAAPFTTVVPTKGAVAVPSFIFPRPAPREQQ